MKKLRFHTVKHLDGTFLGKVKTVMCKTQKGFDRQFTRHMKKRTEKPVMNSKPRIRPVLNTEMLAPLDQGENNG